MLRSCHIKSPINKMVKIQDMIFAFAFIPAGLLLVILFGKVTILECNYSRQNQIVCQLESSGLLGKKLTKIKQIQGTEVEVNSDSDGDTYRVVIISKNGKIPLTDYYSSGRLGKYRQVEQINYFINNPETPNLKIKNDGRWFAYPSGGIFILIGIITLATILIGN